MTRAIADGLENFRRELESALTAALVRDDVDCEDNRRHARCAVTPGAKYARVDSGTSGKYMVDLVTGEIFGIKGYGRVHLGHRYGTLETVGEWDWGHYYAKRRAT
jgi:hypothetical protein